MSPYFLCLWRNLEICMLRIRIQDHHDYNTQAILRALFANSARMIGINIPILDHHGGRGGRG